MPTVSSRKIEPNPEGIKANLSKNSGQRLREKSVEKREMGNQSSGLDEDLIMEFLRFNERFLITSIQAGILNPKVPHFA